MTKAEVKHKIFSVMAEDMGIEAESISLQQNLIDDLGLDDLDHIDIAMDLEKGFRIEIPDTEISTWVTVEDICSYLYWRVGA